MVYVNNGINLMLKCGIKMGSKQVAKNMSKHTKINYVLTERFETKKALISECFFCCFRRSGRDSKEFRKPLIINILTNA